MDPRTAQSDAKGLVNEIYRTIDRGKTDSLFSLVADPVVVFGPRRVDAMMTRSDALVALGTVVDTKGNRSGKAKRAQLRSGGLDVVVSPGGHSAWAFDVISIEGRQLAVTAVLSNTDDLWAVSAAALAETPSSRQARTESARDAIVPPGVPALPTAIAKIAPGAGDAVERLRKGMLDQQTWGDDLAGQDAAIVAGPVAGEVARGPRAIKRAWTARMKSRVREVATGELTAAITADGQLVWISVPVTRVAEGEDPLPLRIFAIYEKTGAVWRMAALHEAAAIDEPGRGTAFKKIVPPEPPKAEPPKAEPPKPDDKTPASTAAAARPKKPKKKPKPPTD